MKKLLFLAVMCVFTVGVLYAGGQGAGEESAGITMNPPGTYPVVNEKVTIDVIAYYSSTTSTGTPEDAKFTLWFEELTNVHINWVEMIESASAGEKFNLILASGDLPDLLIPHGAITAQQVYQHGREGSFQPLNDLIDKYAPDMKREFNTEEGKAFRSRLTMPDGNIYAFPDVEAGCFHCQYSLKMWVYTPWVEKLGIDWPPKTTEDFYEMLKAFKAGDPNGNGEADEIPFLGATTSWRTDPIGFLMNSFIYTMMPHYANGYGAFLERNGNAARFVADTNEWREGLKYLNRLQVEGLLASESFVWTRDESRSAVENPDKELVGAFPSGWFGVMTFNGAGTGRFAGFHPIAPLTGPAGERQSGYFPPTMRYQSQITKEADGIKPAVITQMLNWFFEDVFPNHMLAQNFNEEGTNWRYTTQEELDAGYTSRDGKPSIMTPIERKVGAYERDLFDDGWPRTSPIRWTLRDFMALPPTDAEDPSKQEWRLMVSTRDLMEPYKTTHYMPPDIVFPEEIEDEMTDLTNTIVMQTGLVLQRSTEFITGVRDINSDAEWDNYKKELKRAGVDRYVELWNEALAGVTF